MQSNMHPDWQLSSEQPVAVHGKRQPVVEEHQKTSVSISRQPAALVGMIAVIALGFIFFNGMDVLKGQVAPSTNVMNINITENGPEPPRIEVEHGTTLTFQNMQDVPHILESNTLCSDTGFCLQTKTLFNGDSDTFSITPDMQLGSYEYFSSISEDVRGEIVIVSAANAEFQDFTDIMQDSIFGNDQNTNAPVIPPSPFDDYLPPPTDTAISDFPSNSMRIPTNPYTVESDRMHPFDSNGEPIPEAFGDDPYEDRRDAVASQVFQGGRGPISQPQTGAGMWIVVLASIGALWVVTRSLLASTENL